MAAYLLCAALTFRQTEGPPQIRRSATTLLNAFAVVAAVAVSAACHLASGPVVGYAIAGFSGTLSYIVAVPALCYWTEHQGGSRSQ
jgi:hypothetical protein